MQQTQAPKLLEATAVIHLECHLLLTQVGQMLQQQHLSMRITSMLLPAAVLFPSVWKAFSSRGPTFPKPF